MKKLLSITLGIMTALGGFVDLGQIVFVAQAGALFRYQLMWAIVLGTAAIIVYMEMCGRVAVVAREPVFSVVRTRLGFPLGLFTLIASNLLAVITCAAELGGVAIVLHLLTGWPEKAILIAATATIVAMIFFLQFEWIERTFGFSGLLMLVFAVAACTLKPNWHEMAAGLLPEFVGGGGKQTLLYSYFAVGIFSAMLMEYEVHFYSSGAIEEGWKPKDLGQNFMVASVGSVLGTLLTISLLALGALVFQPEGVFPQTLSAAVFAGAYPFAQKALLLALLGTLACIAGAAVETALSGGYNICQFFKKPWGKDRSARDVPLFVASWIGTFVIALIIALSGVRPLTLVNISIIFGMAIMPLTYYPILRAAADPAIMGQHVNTKLLNVAGGFFLLLIVLAALAAIPLMVVTHSGQP